MHFTGPYPFVALLMLVYAWSPAVAFAGHQGLSATTPSATSARPLAIVVEVENDARIPPADLAAMKEVVSRSYLAVGVQVIWVHGEVPRDDPRGLRVHLRLLSRTRANRKIAAEPFGSAVLGHANRPARVADIFCHRIVEASMKYRQEYTRVLGLVGGEAAGRGAEGGAG